MKLKLFIPLILVLLFPQFIRAQDSSGTRAVNCLQILRDLSLEALRLEKRYNSPSAEKITETSEGLSSGVLSDNSAGEFDSLLLGIENISLPGDALAVYSSISNNFMPEISFSEVGFHLLNAVQRHLESLLQALRSDKKLVSMAIFATSNLEISRMKTALLRREIRILSECGKKEERLRCWLALRRMLNEIDIPRSERGNSAVQNSPCGIQVLPGEIETKLMPLSENETDEEVRAYSSGVLKEIRSAPSKYKEGVIQIALNELGNFNPRDRLINSEALRLFHRADSTALRTEKISLYTGAVKIDPKFTAAYTSRGSLYYEAGDYKKAAEDFKKALSLDAGYYTLYKYLAGCSYKTGDMEDAVKNFTEALKYEITDTLLVSRGICYRKLGQLKPAASDFSAAIRFNSRSLPARINRAQCYLALRQYEEAAKDYEKLILQEPRNSSHYYNLGCLYAIEKDWMRVVSTWEAGLLANPRDENILKNLPKAKANLASQTGKEKK